MPGDCTRKRVHIIGWLVELRVKDDNRRPGLGRFERLQAEYSRDSVGLGVEERLLDSVAVNSPPVAAGVRSVSIRYWEGEAISDRTPDEACLT